MSCDRYFSLANLAGSSFEREAASTTLCLPNTLKAGIFITSLLVFSLLLLLSISLILADYKKTSNWNLTKKMATTMLLTSLVEVILQILFLCGVESRGRYILFPLPFMCTTWASRELTNLWYSAVTESKSFQLHSRQGFYGSLHRVVDATTVAHWVTYLLLWAILPMVYYEEPHKLNIVYTVMIVQTGLVGLTCVTLLLVTTFKLLKLFNQNIVDKNSGELSKVLKKLHDSKRLFLFLYSIIFPLFFFPIWLGVTMTPEDPGLQGNFYFHFLVLGFNKACSVGAVFFVVMKIGREPSTSQAESGSGSYSQHQQQQQHQDPSKAAKAAAFTFTVEELTQPSA